MALRQNRKITHVALGKDTTRKQIQILQRHLDQNSLIET